MPITFRLRELLDTRADGLTQAELARRAGLSANAINEIAQNKTSRISLATLEALCRALGISPGEMFEWADAPTPSRSRRARS